MKRDKRLREILRKNSDYLTTRGKIRTTKGYERKIKVNKKDVYSRDYDRDESNPESDRDEWSFRRR
jgi:hypothetical protein